VTKPSAQLDSIRADAVYPKAPLCRNLGWGKHTLAKARRDGLGPWIRYGRSVYIRGVDVLAFFDKLADEQATGSHATESSGRPDGHRVTPPA
jgi:hypothetical protein